MKASRAAASFAFSRQRGVSTHDAAIVAKTFDQRVRPFQRPHDLAERDRLGGRASEKPPPAPRWVAMKPPSARSRTTLAR